MNDSPRLVTRQTKLVQVRPELALSVTDYSLARDSAVVANAAQPVEIVLLHGLSSNALMWAGVATELAQRGHRCVAVDLRGHGQSDKPTGPYDLQTVTDDVAMLLAAQGISRPVLVGQSWGANVVVEFAARFPGLTRGVMPVDGGFIELSKSFPIWEDCEREMAPPKLAGTPVSTIEGWMRSAHPTWPESGIVGIMGFVQVHPDGTASPWLSFENHIKVLRGLWEHRPTERYALIADPVWWLVAGTAVQSPSGEDAVGETVSDGGWASRKHASISVAEAALRRCRTTWMDGDHDLHAQFPVEVAALLVEGISEGFFV
jgi:pimeloyl-ACP methyl ester carboxylesterase